MKTFQAAEARGHSWGFSPQAVKAREQAERKFSGLASKVTVHRDIHLKNILVRAGREAHLIDYARSGPGHPAVDLVRLELSLLLSAFRQTADIATCEELQKDLNSPLSDAEELVKRHSALCTWAINRVCIRGMVEARNSVVKLLKQNGGDESDYFAAKCLVAWEALLTGNLQMGLAAVVILSLTEQFS